MSEKYVGPLTGLLWGTGWFGSYIAHHLPLPWMLLVWGASAALASAISIWFIVKSEGL